MPEDRGGLQYTIAVENQFSGPLNQFRSEVEAARAAIRGLQQDAKNLRGAVRDSAQSVRQTAQASQQSAQASQQSAASSGRRARALSVEAAAEEKLRREIHAGNVERRTQILAESQGLARTRTTIQQLQLQTAAEAALTKFRNSRLTQIRQHQALEAKDARARAKRLSDTQRIADQTKVLTDQVDLQAQVEAGAREFAQKFNKDLADRQKLLDSVTKGRQKAAAAEAAAAAKEQAAAQARAQALDPVFRAQQAFQQRLLDLETTLELRKLEQGSRRFRQLREEIRSTEARANRISFTFRRLFGILAAFTAARLAAQALRNMVVESIRFNAQLEISQLSIASLITAVGDVRDSLGGTLDATERLAAAQGIARRQVQLLRLEALRTASTFDQLVENFQLAIAPGLSAGFNLDEIRKFTVRISQAATAIGLPQQQLAEEIRSLLQGTIQARTTRIATSLGITNEDIRNAKEAGNLAEFLLDRFEAFKVAGDEAFNTFTVLLSNTKDALLALISSGGFEFFKEIKGLLKDILEDTIELTEQGPVVDPGALQVVRALFDGLRGAVAEARALRESIDLQPAIGAARALGVIFIELSRLTSFIAGNLATGFAFVLSLVNAAAAIFGQFAEAVGDSVPVRALKEGLGTVIRMSAALGTVLIGLQTFGALIKLIRLPFILILASIKNIGVGLISLITNARRLTTVFLRWAAPVLLLYGTLKAIEVLVEKPLGGKFETGLKQIGVGIDAFTAKALNKFRAFVTGNKEAEKALDDLINKTAQLRLQQIDANADSDRTLAGIFESKVGELGSEFGKLIDEVFESVNKRFENITTSASGFEQILEEIPGLIGAATRQFELQDQVVRRLKDDIRDAGFELETASATIGLSGAAASLLQQQLSIRQNAERESVDLVNREAEIRSRLDVILKRRASLANEAARIEGENTGLIKQQEEATKALLFLQQRQIRARLQNNEAAVAELEQRSKQILDQATRNLGALDAEDQQRALDIIKERIAIEGEEKLLKENLITISETLTGLEDQLREASVQRIRAIAQEESFRLEDERGALEAQIQGQELLFRSRLSLNQQTRDLAEIEAQRLETLADQLKENRQYLRNLEAIDALIQAQVENGQDITDLERLRANLLKTQELSLERQLQVLREIELTRAKLRKREEDPTGAAALEFGEEFTTKALDQFQVTLDLMREAVQGFSQFAATEISNALVGGDEETTRERFHALVRGLLNSLIQALVDAAIAKLIEDQVAEGLSALQREANEAATISQASTGASQAASILTSAASSAGIAIAQGGTTAATELGFAANAWTAVATQLSIVAKELAAAAVQAQAAATAQATASVASAGAAHGGKAVRRAYPQISHYGAKGFAGGGSNRDPRDVVPIWVRLGEWMIPPESVRMYGDQFMAAVQKGKIDPMAARMLSGFGSTSLSAVRPTKPSFAEGGQATSRLSSDSGSRSGSGEGFQRALVVSNDQEASRLTSGGRNAFLRFIREERGTINNLLLG